jgi:myo-inositol-1(or 4)-monophosphatase
MNAGRALMSLIKEAAEAAAKVIRLAEPRRALLEWQHKGTADFVTEVDIAAEAAAVEVILAAEPTASILAEELSPEVAGATSHPLQFVIDPLDGTTNFLHGLPEYAVSIGALTDGVLVGGVVLNVPRNELFHAGLGRGAWLGDDRIHVSKVTEPIKSLIGTGFPFKTPAQIPGYLEQMDVIMRSTSGIRRPGAASIDLAHVAAGRFDGFWELHLSPWDVAAGILLIREAGGLCTDLDGVSSRPAFGAIVAGNPAIHPWLLGTLRVAR